MISRTIEQRAEGSPDESARSLLSAAAVRSTARRVLTLALDRSLDDWTVDMARLPATAEFVGKVVRDRYPTLHPPFHARWRHFVFDGRDLWGAIAAKRSWHSSEAAARAGGGSAAAARAAFDLAITSVLLDAGAGPEWRYHAPQSDR